MRDFLSEPARLRAELAPGTKERLDAALRVLLGPEVADAPGTVGIFVTPGDLDPSIEDARKLADCRACGARVWISPSSIGALANGAIPICLRCIGRELARQERV